MTFLLQAHMHLFENTCMYYTKNEKYLRYMWFITHTRFVKLIFVDSEYLQSVLYVFI